MPTHLLLVRLKPREIFFLFVPQSHIWVVWCLTNMCFVSSARPPSVISCTSGGLPVETGTSLLFLTFSLISQLLQPFRSLTTLLLVLISVSSLLSELWEIWLSAGSILSAEKSTFSDEKSLYELSGMSYLLPEFICWKNLKKLLLFFILFSRSNLVSVAFRFFFRTCLRSSGWTNFVFSKNLILFVWNEQKILVTGCLL